MTQHEFSLKAGDTLVVSVEPDVIPEPPPPPTPPYTFPLPGMTDAMFIRLNASGPQTVTIPTGVDAIIEPPFSTIPWYGQLTVRGGRNVMVRNGVFQMRPDLPIPTSVPPEPHDKWRMFTFRDQSHSAILSNIQVRNPNNRHFDVMVGGGAATPDWYLQNVRVENLRGQNSGWHADIVQPWARAGTIFVEQCTLESNYQAFYLDAAARGVIRLNLHRTNLRHPQASQSSLFWVDGTPVTATETYADVRSGRPLEGDGKFLPIAFSAPPGGDFCPAKP